MQVLGVEAISDSQGLRHLAPVIGPVASTPTVWRALSETGPLQLARVNAAVVAFRRHWWGQLAADTQGFPWLKVAGRELTGVRVVDLEVSRLPGRYRRRVLVRRDGAGSGSSRLRWSCTDKETDAIEQLSRGAWTAGIDQNAQPHRRHVRR
jgi:hypothetical protein